MKYTTIQLEIIYDKCGSYWVDKCTDITIETCTMIENLVYEGNQIYCSKQIHKIELLITQVYSSRRRACTRQSNWSANETEKKKREKKKKTHIERWQNRSWVNKKKSFKKNHWWDLSRTTNTSGSTEQIFITSHTLSHSHTISMWGLGLWWFNKPSQHTSFIIILEYLWKNQQSNNST